MTKGIVKITNILLQSIVRQKKMARVLLSVHAIAVYMSYRAHGVLDQCAASIQSVCVTTVLQLSWLTVHLFLICSSNPPHPSPSTLLPFPPHLSDRVQACVDLSFRSYTNSWGEKGRWDIGLGVKLHFCSTYQWTICNSQRLSLGEIS